MSANEARIKEIEAKYLAAKPGTAEFSAYWGCPTGALQKEYAALLDDKAKALDKAEPWRQPSEATGPSWQK